MRGDAMLESAIDPVETGFLAPECRARRQFFIPAGETR